MHYMVDISERIKEIKLLIDEGKYFCINRARQYGKTTTLVALKNNIKEYYTVVSLNFQSIDNDVFKNGSSFSQALSRIVLDLAEFEGLKIPDNVISQLKEIAESKENSVKMDELFRVFRRWILVADKPLVLIIDLSHFLLIKS